VVGGREAGEQFGQERQKLAALSAAVLAVGGAGALREKLRQPVHQESQ
jgi:transcriptional regulator of acetoin/glycerol metabolism